MSTRKLPIAWPWLALIVTAGLSLRIAAIFSFQHVPESDELAYNAMATNLLSGNGIVDSMGNHAMYNVGYPLFILFPTYFVFGENILAAKIINAIIGSGTIIICYHVAKEAGAGLLGCLLAAAIWAIYLPASVYTVYLAKEILMTPLMLGVIWSALKLSKKASLPIAAGCGLLLGLLALTGNAGLALTAAVAVSIFFMPATMHARIYIVGLVFLTATLVASPWMIRNFHAIGAPVLNTNGGFNLYLGNNPAATGFFVSISDTPMGEQWRTLRQHGEVHASNTLKNEAISWILENPKEALILSIKKAFYFWTPPFHDGVGEQSSIEKIIRIAWALQFLIMITAATCAGINSKKNRGTIILLTAVAAYTCAHMLFYVIFRYREPIMPTIGVLAAISLEHMYKRLSIR